MNNILNTLNNTNINTQHIMKGGSLYETKSNNTQILNLDPIDFNIDGSINTTINPRNNVEPVIDQTINNQHSQIHQTGKGKFINPTTKLLQDAKSLTDNVEKVNEVIKETKVPEIIEKVVEKEVPVEKIVEKQTTVTKQSIPYTGETPVVNTVPQNTVQGTVNNKTQQPVQQTIVQRQIPYNTETQIVDTASKKSIKTGTVLTQPQVPPQVVKHQINYNTQNNPINNNFTNEQFRREQFSEKFKQNIINKEKLKNNEMVELITMATVIFCEFFGIFTPILKMMKLKSIIKDGRYMWYDSYLSIIQLVKIIIYSIILYYSQIEKSLSNDNFKLLLTIILVIAFIEFILHFIASIDVNDKTETYKNITKLFNNKIMSISILVKMFSLIVYIFVY